MKKEKLEEKDLTGIRTNDFQQLFVYTMQKSCFFHVCIPVLKPSPSSVAFSAPVSFSAPVAEWILLVTPVLESSYRIQFNLHMCCKFFQQEKKSQQKQDRTDDNSCSSEVNFYQTDFRFCIFCLFIWWRGFFTVCFLIIP